MGRNLTTLFISQSYQFLTQISGSELQDGLGNTITGSLDITASLADNATSASYASTSVSSSYSTTALSASYAATALSASHAINADSALTANTATTASYVLNAVSSSYSTTALSSSYASTATSSSVAINATSASYATSALSSSYALTASFALNAGVTVDTGSLMKTGSVSSNTLTFTKGDGSTFNLTVDTGSAVTTDTGSLLVTASISNATTTFTKGDGSTFSITANNVVNADSASLAANATSASFATTATSASYATNALSASQADNANTATSASYATNALSSSYALTASYAANVPDPVSTGSLLTTASAAGNVLTFTKGDASTFNVTVDTGSAGASVLVQSATNNITFADTASFPTSITDASSSIVLGKNLSITGAVGYTTDVIMIGGDGNAFELAGGAGATTGSAMLGGINNKIQGSSVSSFIIGGENNILRRPYIANGGQYNGIIGGANNYAGNVNGPPSGMVIVTGNSNGGEGYWGGIFGGNQNRYNSSYGFIGGGSYNNDAGASSYCVILGGEQNYISYGEQNGIIASKYGNLRARNVFMGGVNGARNLGYSQHGPGYGAIIGGDTIDIPDFQGYNYVFGSFNNIKINYPGSHYNVTSFSDKDGVYSLGVGSLSGGKDGNYGGFFANNVNLKYTSSTWMTSVMNSWGTSVTGSSTDNNFITNTSGSTFTNNKDFVAMGAQGISATGITGSFILPNSGSRTYNDNYTLYGENLSFRGSLYDSTNSTGSSGQVLSSNASGQLEWIAAGGGGSIDTGSFATTGSNTFIGNQIVSGSLEVTSGITGSLLGTASFADSSTSSSYATTALSASYALSATTASYALTSTSASYALSSSHADSANSAISSSYSATATSASYAATVLSASYALNSTSASIADSALSSSYALTASFVTTAQTASYYDLSAVTQNAVFSGSVRGDVGALSISSNTASLDCSTGNFFTLLLVSGSNTFVNPSNINPGQTINLRIKQASVASGSISFASSIKQVSGSSYTPTETANGEDIITFISFDSTNLYLSNIKNFV